MAFPIPLASKMSGATVRQLAYWRKSGVLTPEIESHSRPYLYSFRDIVALRTIAWLRVDRSLQSIRKSLDTLRELDMLEHPSAYTLVKNGESIAVMRSEGQAVDLAGQPGQTTVGNLEDVFQAFSTTRDRRVDALRNPRPGVEVNPARLGGWPTITGTRIPYDVVAELIDDGTVPAERVGEFYPGVTPAAARDALDYQRSVQGIAA